MSVISPSQARAFLERWKQVEATQLELQRSESLEIRLRQLSILMTSRELFGSNPEREVHVRQIRDRWLRIREALGG